ncbi:MAG: hypothetical protein IJ572_00645 [Bacilli bacterium]|nr:hypothetical protein [Bacilli bacterium]
MNTKGIQETITNILKNKNTLTILIVFAGIIGLYAVYNGRVNEATSLVQVPYAKKELNSRTEITSDSIGFMQVPKSLLSKANNILTSVAAIEKKYVNYGYTIPEYSLFYKEAILTTATPESEFANIPDGYTVYSLDVDFDLTYGNSIYPGNYIDLYVKTKDDETGKIVFGRLIKGIKVMAVYDGNGKEVFESSSEARNPKYMWFSVQNELFDLLNIAVDNGVEILPIPRNASYSSEEREPEIDSTAIQERILSKAVNLR